MRHFLLKRSSSAAGSSRPRSALSPQPAKTVPQATQPEPKPAPRDRSRSASRRTPPKRHGPRPKIVLDPAPKALSWSTGQEEGVAKSRGCRINPQAASVETSKHPVSVPGAEGNVFFAVIGPVQVPKQLTGAIAYIIKHKHSQKESRFLLPHNTSGLSPTWRQTPWSNPTPCHAGRGKRSLQPRASQASTAVTSSSPKKMAAYGPSSISEPWTVPSWDGRSGWLRWNRSSRKYAQGTGSFNKIFV